MLAVQFYWIVLFVSKICHVSSSNLSKNSENTLKLLNIESKIKEKFLSQNVDHSSLENYNNSLTIFQHKLLKSRNYKCDAEIDFNHNNYMTLDDLRWREILNAWDQLNLNIDVDSNVQTILTGFEEACIDANSLIKLFSIHNITEKSQRNKNYESLFNLVLAQLSNKGCDMCTDKIISEKKSDITKAETWGYSLLFVTIISMSSLCGAFVIPLSGKKFYKKILMVMIGVAVGSLAGSGFLHLIPQAFGIADDPGYSLNHEYVWKALVMMGALYFFYLVEKIFKLMMLRKKIKRNNSKVKKTQNGLNNILKSESNEKEKEPFDMQVQVSECVKIENGGKSNHGHSHHLDGLQSIAPVAWMIIFGDSLHNFIDGLSIGAAFTESTMKGASISLAVMCEEFPHELGDFAILLNAGMSYRWALFFNFLSACSCYVGVVIGIVLGDNFSANQWIYAIAGGMFLYISLCDMVPELNEMGDELEKDYLIEKRQLMIDEGKIPEEEINLDGTLSALTLETFDLKIKLKVLFLQNLGIIFGFVVMLIMAIKSDGLLAE